MKQTRGRSTTYGFTPASRLLQSRIRTASESRGFAVTRLLTHWEEIVGASVARIARPVDISYGRKGLGATLTVLTTGPNAPMLEMQKQAICEKVNGCYGYRAISRVRITQTAPSGFAEGATPFDPAPGPDTPRPDPDARAAAATDTAGVADAGLRAALEALATNVYSKHRIKKGS